MHGAGLADELPKLRCWITSGEPLSTELLKSFLSAAPAGTKLTNTYGSTEVAGDVTWVTFSAGMELPVEALAPIGAPMPGVRIHILDPDTLRPMEHGSAGELFVGGDFLAEGYLNRPEEEAARFLKIPSLGLERVFRTGDFGRLNDASLIEFLGRKDQQVKVHGQRVEVLHVEYVLQNALRTINSEGQAPQAAIMAVPSELDIGSYHLHAFIERDAASQKSIDLSEIKKQMLQSLIPAHIPEAMWIEDTLPRLPNSKLDRASLLALAKERGFAEKPQLIEETDSFGQIRHIAAQYANSRRALGNMMTFSIFKVILGHWTEYWFAYGVVPNSSTWMRTLVAESGVSEDVVFLVFALAVMHGMGGEERFRLSMTEPIMITLWVFMKYILGPYVFAPVSALATGASLYKCYPFFSGSFAYALTPCSGSRISYFLLMAALARILIIGWHKLTGKFASGRPGSDCVLIVGVTVYVQFVTPGVMVYLIVYLASFYYGPQIVQMLSSQNGPQPVLCILGLCCWLGGAWSLTSSGIFSPFDDRSTSAFFAMICNVPVTLAACLFFSNLPRFMDFQLPGNVILIIYMTHYFFLNWVLHGTHFYGFRVLPSLPDFVWQASQFPMPLKLFLEPLALITPVVAYMSAMSVIARVTSSAVQLTKRWATSSAARPAGKD